MWFGWGQESWLKLMSLADLWNESFDIFEVDLSLSERQDTHRYLNEQKERSLYRCYELNL